MPLESSIPELHLFIVWEKGSDKLLDIVADLQAQFEVLRAYEMRWSRRSFSRNLSRFYGQNLPPSSGKERHCGDGPFTLIVVRDNDPIYGPRNTSKGVVEVNLKAFDAKEKYRAWTGGGHRIHATNSPAETAHDLTLLLGVDAEKFQVQTRDTWDGMVPVMSRDLTGSEGWDSLSQLFSILNDTVAYVVLRNFEYLPARPHVPSHGDIDLLTGNYVDLCYVANARKVYRASYRVHHAVRIGGQDVLFDFRYVGDEYYDHRWQQDILSRRLLSPNGFYIPDDENHFFSLLYHAAVHKPRISADYVTKLLGLASALELELPRSVFDEDGSSLRSYLRRFLDSRGYSLTVPRDLSVFYNEEIGDRDNVGMRRRLHAWLQKPVEQARTVAKSLLRGLRD